MMTHVDEPRLESDTAARFAYLKEFMGFGESDVAAIRTVAPKLAPMAPALVDAVYDKLQQYDATWRHFLPRQHGYAGDTPASLAQLTMDHPQIAFRKQHLARYLGAILQTDYGDGTAKYLDMVGKMHTPKAGSPDLDVPLVQMNALMGFVADALLATIAGLGLDRDTELKAQRAFNKVLWLQNDFIVRHHAA